LRRTGADPFLGRAGAVVVVVIVAGGGHDSLTDATPSGSDTDESGVPGGTCSVRTLPPRSVTVNVQSWAAAVAGINATPVPSAATHTTAATSAVARGLPPVRDCARIDLDSLFPRAADAR
jgi:hypothetical protein